MKFRLGILFILIIFLFHPIPATHAQKVKGDRHHTARNQQDSLQAARKHILDSTRTAQQAHLDSVKDARQHIVDSTRDSRQHILDSMKAARRHVTDSLNAIHKYRSSRHYQDSVAAARKVHADSIRNARMHVLDSMKTARQHITDSIVAVRKAHLDSVRAVQKHRSDSLAVVRKYRQSKRYRDSVSIARTDRLDSIRDARKQFNDSVLAVRQHIRDSTNTSRKHITDSITTVRNRFLDSLKTVRKQRTDSLAKVKKEREKAEKARATQRQQKMQMALDLKIKEKREKWSNEKMLKKKWSVPRKIEQNTFSRYNYYYNANRKMDEALANMQRAHKEDYDSLIGLYPFDPNRDSSLLSADMDSIIHKVSVGIQIHDPRTKWEDDMYLLLGEAYYYKGGYDNAAISFRYIISMDEQRKKKELASKGYNVKSKGPQTSIVENNKKSMLDFLKHKAVHNESILWLSRTYTEAGQLENAESIISLLDSDPNLPDNLKGRIALERAFTYLKDGNYKSASQELTVAVNDNNVPDWLRMRGAFLNGQLLQREGNYDTAALSFKRVLDFLPKIDMDFYARKYMAYNTMYAGGKVNDMMSSFKRLLNDGKYIPYYDQIYYILGTLAASQQNIDDAIAYFRKSVGTMHASRKQKAISFATMGNVYYATGDYMNAKEAYDSAAHLSSADPRDTLMDVAVKRSNALGSITGPVKIIHEQDSLLALASLDEKDQRERVRHYIRELERKREDSIFNAQNAGLNAVAAQEDQNPNAANQAANWYFTNPTSMQQGYNEFKRIWGNRPLVDNWQRMSAIGFNMAGTQGSGQNASDTAQNKTAEGNMQFDENGIPTEQSLLALIPNTPEQKDKSYKLLQRAYIDLGNAYVRELEDYKHAIHTLDTLDSRFPGHGFKPEDYYLRYLIALRQGQFDTAKVYSAKILQDYSGSKYADLVRPRNDSTSIAAGNAEEEADFYDQTYQMLVQHEYPDVIQRSAEAMKKFDDTAYAKRFHIMTAIALAGSDKYKKADSVLAVFMKTNGNDSLRLWADEVVKFMRAYPSGPPPVTPGPTTARQWPYYDYTHNYNYTDEGLGSSSDTVYSVDYKKNNNKPIPYSTEQSNLPALINYQYQPQQPHYFAISLPGMEARIAGLRDSLVDIDTASYGGKGLHVLIDIYSPQQVVLLVSGFTTAEEAQAYMTLVMADTSVFTGYKPEEYNVFTISENNYKKLYFEQNIQAYLAFYSMYYKQTKQP